ncbi:MAG: FecR domain-containing protein [Gallionella sp.]|nr:FecR domain-containing protein [Gallionella sp.]
MNKIAFTVLAFALTAGISSTVQAAGKAAAATSAAPFVQASENRVYVISGEVFAAQGKNPTHRVTDYEVISSGTFIKTGDNGSALLKFKDGQTVSMRANSLLQVREYHYDARRIGNSSIVFSMFKGGMHFVTGQIGLRNKQAFRLLTPNATINIHGTDFVVAMSGNSVYSQVLKGRIRMTNAVGTSIIREGQSAVVASSGSGVSLLAASAIPSGTFDGLLSIPAFASVIPARAPAPVVTRAMPGAVTPAQTNDSRIYAVSGDVSVAQGKNPAHRVIGNEIIVPDTLVQTGDQSAALLKFEDGQVVTMKANSTFHVREYRYDRAHAEKSSVVFSMFKGGMRFITGQISQRRKQSFKLLTPNATIGIRGTDFLVTMVDSAMYSEVLAGEIVVTNFAGMAAVAAGHAASLATPKSPAVSMPSSAIPSGTFGDLLSIPVDPSAIPAPVPIAVAAPVAEPVSAPVPEPMPAPAPEPMPAPAPPIPAPASMPAPVLAPALAPVPIPATDTEPVEETGRSGMGLTAKVGTLGYGAEFNFGKSDSFSTRIGLNAYTYKHNAKASTVNYDFKLQLQTASALADWYPFEGGFRASGGLFYNNNKATLGGNPTGGDYIINGVTYTSAQIGSLQATMTFNKAAPYLGIGWGNPVAKNKGWGMVSDIGVMFQGKPKIDLTVTCATSCPQLSTDAAAENAKLQEDLSKFQMWPVISFGISYQW